MKFWYNLFFTIFFVASAPYYFWRMYRRGGWQEGFQERFGRYPTRLKAALTNRHILWIHAVSVGEVNIATQLIRTIEARLPNLKLVVSTTTSTGMAELRKRLPSHIEKIYYPVDRKKYVSRALRVLSPEAIVLVEAEIWPNFLWTARARGIPVFLVNARLSDKSFRGYRRFGFLFHQLFRAFAGVGVQNENDRERLLELGAKPEAVRAVGNLKFDGAVLSERASLDVTTLLQKLGVQPGDPVIVAGSTHAGEEAILARIAKRLQRDFPGLFLIVVPRHFERGKEAGSDVQAAGLKSAYRTDISAASSFRRASIECLLVNTTGELRDFYRAATVIFVGKSLAGEGGQNPIEPAALGKPILFGPNMQNFASIADAFLKAGGAIQVRDENELEQSFRELLRNPERRQQIGQKGLEVVRANRGSMDRTVDMIVEHLKEEDVYVAPSVA
ncbi:MAG TPA: 3-deoxy-D-manno-octulosonic acid transferase [Verrucomicrobiae bacterium]|jgi:3-deoxy-D-manno-octulosonic-acid transferase|nr:3-deoxy-D-manno-octulosonic acid transferase [Verrucomicrobiae bacterium]